MSVQQYPDYKSVTIVSSDIINFDTLLWDGKKARNDQALWQVAPSEQPYWTERQHHSRHKLCCSRGLKFLVPCLVLVLQGSRKAKNISHFTWYGSTYSGFGSQKVAIPVLTRTNYKLKCLHLLSTKLYAEQYILLTTCKTFLVGTDKKSLIPRPTLLANPIGFPITPADPKTYKENY